MPSEPKEPLQASSATPPVSGFCPVHPHNNAIGRCRRCEQPYCDVCAIRWQKEPVCLACFTKILEGKEATPGDRARQQWEGSASLVLAIIGWVLFLSSFWLFWSICDGRGGKNAAMLNLVVFLASFIAPLLSLGLAGATLHNRGPGMTRATWGLVLAGLQIGVTLSLVVVNITHN
jgi:hypothetical protein